MGLSNDPTRHGQKQATHGRKRAVRRPRTRRCLLKGCERRFRPRHARQRYCSQGCCKAAREWSAWRGRRRWRASAGGKQKRNRQSHRYRERLKARKAPEKKAVPETARVIPRKFFLMAAATGRAATNASCDRGDRRGNGSARMRASVPWSAFGNASGAGDGDRPGVAIFLEGGLCAAPGKARR
jgi:hypothetical protein